MPNSPSGGHQVGHRVGHRFSTLDGLRGLAAALVLGFDLQLATRSGRPAAPWQHLLDGGYLMADLFFTLSGFFLCRTVMASRPFAIARFARRRLRRFAPLHLFACGSTLILLALASAGNSRPGVEVGSVRGWLSSAFLACGLLGPDQAGYPGAWWLSIALCSSLLIVAVAALVPASLQLHGRMFQPRDLIAPAAILAGTTLLLRADPNASYTVGGPAFGRGLLGLGAGMLAFRLLEAQTGDVEPPPPSIAPPRRLGAGGGAALSAGGLLLCAYRSDLVLHLHLLPVFAVASVAVFFCAQSDPGPIHRLLDLRPVQWLGSRSFALFALHGPALLAIGLVGGRRDVEPASSASVGILLASAIIGSMLAAELGHRYLEAPASLGLSGISGRSGFGGLSGRSDPRSNRTARPFSSRSGPQHATGHVPFDPALLATNEPTAPPLIPAEPFLPATAFVPDEAEDSLPARPGVALDLRDIPPELRLLPLPGDAVRRTEARSGGRDHESPELAVMNRERPTRLGGGARSSPGSGPRPARAAPRE